MNFRKKIIIIAKTDSEDALKIAKKIYEILLMRKDVEILVERELSWKLNIEYGVTLRDTIADIIIAIGGDGTILRVADEVKERDIPILAINAGTVGFLSEIYPDELNFNELAEKIYKAINGNYHTRNCTRLKATIERFAYTEQVLRNIEEVYPPLDALNEITIMTSIPSKLICLNIKKDGSEVFKGRCDGVIISTTTGSTAYSLSAGGPVIDPSLDVFIITPLSPLKLIQRSIVISVDSQIEVEVCEKGVEAIMIADGRYNIRIPTGTKILLKKSEYSTKLIRIDYKDFYSKLKNRIYMEL
ncbi:MAG: NAD(+)/NADH kinase [Candidatus Methanomethylicia archaeon]|nr:NAD(+)/NADH kinase [Candidatus Methanomethylicia archaeon]MCX8169255.1 NAD(+)/NADH kinase [Candidatus Methanomethylicia archaeon]MDW7988963.1 NAD(+)/NADH kinase [Nitrososphaerota archaeon]